MPIGDEALFDEYFSLIDQRVAIGQRVVEAMRGEDLLEISTLSDSTDEIQAEADGIAQGYGFEICVETD